MINLLAHSFRHYSHFVRLSISFT